MLSQSDIFSHFGATKGIEQSVHESKSGQSRRAVVAADELDDDERAMAQEIGEDENEENGEGRSTLLLRQPSCIKGGTMR